MSNVNYNQGQSESHFISGNAVAGTYDFALNPDAPNNNILQYFHFLDSVGSIVTPTGTGQVQLLISPGNAQFEEFTENGTFTVSSANSATRIKPTGYGRAEMLRVVITGTIVGASTFTGVFSQNLES